MKLLFITTKNSWGGSEPLWCEAAGRALAEGNEVTVVLPQVEKLARPIEDLASKGAKMVMRPPRVKSTLLQKLVRRTKGDREPETTWWRSHFPDGFDAMCISQGGASCGLYMPGLARWLTRYSGKYVVVCQSSRTMCPLDDDTRGSLRRYFSHAAKVCFTAEANRRETEMAIASSIDNAFVHQNPLDFSTLAEVEWPECQVPLISCPGRLLIEDKGQEILLQVMAAAAWRDRSYRLQFFGEGPDKKYLMELTTFLGLGDKVTFCGKASGMLPIWKRTHLMVLPSKSEGLPLVLVGAMAAGRPAVVTDVGGHAEWVREGVDGFVARTSTTSSVGEAMERAWQKRELWTDIGQTARKRYLELRAEDPVGDLLDLLKECACGGALISK